MLTNLYNSAALIVSTLKKAWSLCRDFKNVPTSVGLQMPIDIKKAVQLMSTSLQSSCDIKI